MYTPTIMMLHAVPLRRQNVMREPMDPVLMMYPLSRLLRTKATPDQLSFGGGGSELIVRLSPSRQM